VQTTISDLSVEQLERELKDFADAIKILNNCKLETAYAFPIWLKLDHAYAYLRGQVNELCAPFLEEAVTA